MDVGVPPVSPQRANMVFDSGRTPWSIPPFKCVGENYYCVLNEPELARVQYTLRTVLPAPNQHIGSYELLSRLGIGGMGEVWKARDTRVGRLVAIKFSQRQFSDRFEREARV